MLSQQRVRTGHNVGLVIGFSHIFICASLEPSNTVLDFRLGRKQHHRDLGRGLSALHLPQEFNAVPIRQENIENDQCKGPLGESVTGFR